MSEKKNVQFLIGVFLIFSIIFGMTGLWAIDIGASAMLIEEKYGESTVTNGWWNRKPVRHYHIGLWFVGICITILSVLLFYSVFFLGDVKNDL